MHRSLLAIPALLVLAAPLVGDTTLTVPPGSTAGVVVKLTIDTFLGSDDDTASGVVNIDSSSITVNPNPGSEPFETVQITDHVINTSGASLDFCFYPIFGACTVPLAVTVDQLDVTLANDLSVPVDADGNWFSDSASYDLVMRLSYDGGSLIGAGSADATANALVSVGGNIDLDSGVLSVTNLDLENIDIVIDPTTLPDGLDGLRVEVDTDFSGVVYSGSFNPCDLDGDGSVNGSDLSILLSEWGNCCQGDLDGNGIVDGADLSQLLSCWTG